MWPEVRASFRLHTGQELARASLDEFIGHVLWYMVNSSDYAVQKREALTTALRGEAIEDSDGLTIRKASNMMDQLEDFESWRTSRV